LLLFGCTAKRRKDDDAIIRNVFSDVFFQVLPVAFSIRRLLQIERVEFSAMPRREIQTEKWKRAPIAFFVEGKRKKTIEAPDTEETFPPALSFFLFFSLFLNKKNSATTGARPTTAREAPPRGPATSKPGTPASLAKSGAAPAPGSCGRYVFSFLSFFFFFLRKRVSFLLASARSSPFFRCLAFSSFLFAHLEIKTLNPK